MAQLVIAAAGAAIGGTLGVTGAQAGWIVGSLVGSAFAPAQKSQGPRLNDLSVSSSAYGTPIPYVQGSPRLAGQIVWASSKREIATTTRSGGKGGGKQKVTTYTYEVDLLILLTDNIIPGISRVWSNGKLVWNKSATSDNATKFASNATSAWTRITTYTGVSTQLPDPTYEASVGTANAPAYRGRGSVFIQGLQLGSSGQIPNLTFEIDYEWAGDHLADGLTLFQTTFASASSADVSASALGSGTQVNGTVNDGFYDCVMDSPGNYRNISWASSVIQTPALSSRTYECYFDLIQIGGLPVSNTTICAMGAGDYYFQLSQNGNGAYGVCYDMGSNSVPSIYTQSGVPAWGTNQHFAVVFRTTGVVDVYINGTRIHTQAYGASTAPTGRMVLGGLCQGGSNKQYKFYGARVRAAEMYSGTSFTVPAAGASSWGVP